MTSDAAQWVCLQNGLFMQPKIAVKAMLDVLITLDAHLGVGHAHCGVLGSLKGMGQPQQSMLSSPQR